MKGIRMKTQQERDNAYKMQLVKRYFYKQPIREKQKAKLDNSIFKKDHMSINKYLTYKGDKVYIKHTALKRLIIESKLKWKDL